MDSDPTPEQIAGTAEKNVGNSGLFQLLGELHDERMICEYFNWNGTAAGKINSRNPPTGAAIAARIREHLNQYPRSRVVVVGNSWGGHTALEVATQLRHSEAPLVIDLMVFLDPSSAGRRWARKPKDLPINVKRAVHYHTHNIYCWGNWEADRIRNIDLGDPKLGYMQDGKPAYHSQFDFRAHVSAEWDQRIHAEIKAAVLQLLPQR